MKFNLKIFFAIIPFFGFAQNPKTEVYGIEISEILLQGSSNVSDYSCFLFEASKNRDLQISSYRADNKLILRNADIKIHAKHFQCNNKVMTNDFLEAIKSDEYPEITISILNINLEEKTKHRRNYNNIGAKILIEIAGEKQEYQIILKSLDLEMDQLTITGSKTVFMTDFNLTPPTAMMGMIKADDQVKIDFTITFKLVE